VAARTTPAVELDGRHITLEALEAIALHGARFSVAVGAGGDLAPPEAAIAAP